MATAPCTAARRTLTDLDIERAVGPEVRAQRHTAIARAAWAKDEGLARRLCERLEAARAHIWWRADGPELAQPALFAAELGAAKREALEEADRTENPGCKPTPKTNSSAQRQEARLRRARLWGPKGARRWFLLALGWRPRDRTPQGGTALFVERTWPPPLPKNGAPLLRGMRRQRTTRGVTGASTASVGTFPSANFRRWLRALLRPTLGAHRPPAPMGPPVEFADSLSVFLPRVPKRAEDRDAADVVRPADKLRPLALKNSDAKIMAAASAFACPVLRCCGGAEKVRSRAPAGAVCS